MDWRILISDGLAPEGKSILAAKAEVLESDSLEILDTVDALIVRSRTKVTAEILSSKASRLKVIGRAGIGVDNIDLEAARAQGIIVVNAPLAATAAAAEHTLALMLALARHLPQADASMRRGEWRKSELIGIELRGKTLGIIGMGRIGTAMAQLAGAIGMQVKGCDALLSAEEIRARGADPIFLENLLATADFISLHVPLCDETLGLINEETLLKIKPGARLICTARGGVVDETALLAALDDGRLAGAALDVFSHEPPGRTSLVEHPRVISTPHIGAQTAEAQARAGIDIATEVLAALHGEALRWRVA